MRILKTEEFDQVINSGVVLVDFFANWCGPCKMLGPVLEELSNEYSNVEFVKVDVDASEEIAARYGIMSIPTIYLFKDGQIIARTMGYVDKNGLKQFIDQSL